MLGGRKASVEDLLTGSYECLVERMLVRTLSLSLVSTVSSDCELCADYEQKGAATAGRTAATASMGLRILSVHDNCIEELDIRSARVVTTKSTHRLVGVTVAGTLLTLHVHKYARRVHGECFVELRNVPHWF